jgi:transcriptional regulator with XRE-family HTH domain
VATKETRAERGRRRGSGVSARLVADLVIARNEAGLSQRTVARLLGWSQSQVSRLERLVERDDVSFTDIASYAAIVGRERGASLYPAGEPIRDKGHQVLVGRFRAMVSSAWRVAAEVPLPAPGDRRAWDLLLGIPGQFVGVEAETRLRDIQAFVRRIRERELEGGPGAILIVLAESNVNRRLLAQLLEALGPRYTTSPRALLRALRDRQPLPGSGVVFA